MAGYRASERSVEGAGHAKTIKSDLDLSANASRQS